MAERVGGFEVLAELGRGADNIVYMVARDDDERRYALKIHRAVPADGKQTLRAFRREAALLASVNHEDLTPIHEVGDDQGRPYLVMDLLEGEDLSHLLRSAPLEPMRAVELLLDVCGPLDAVHRRGLVHRDVKPENIMVLPDGRARLIDFGLAARGDQETGPTAAGTLAYASPEQTGLLRRPVDGRSDLYSLGVVLFECLTGRLPFESADVGELLRQHAVSPAPDVSALASGVPPRLVAIVARLLAKDPDDRFRDGAELVHELAVFAPQHRTIRAPGHAQQADPEAVLTGRTQELERFVQRWERARASRGGIALLRGTGGIGKSWLAGRVAAGAQSEGALVLHGKSSPGDVAPFAPLREAMDNWLATVELLPAVTRDSVHARVRAAAGADGPLLGTLSLRLGGVLGPGATAPQDTSPDRFTAAAAAFLIRLAGEDGLLLLLDDIQWLDTGSQLLLRQLAGKLRTSPVLVLATARNDEASLPALEALVTGLGSGVELDVTLLPLDRAGTAGLIRCALPGVAVHDRLADLLTARGDGNPFVVLEYLSAVVDAGLLRPSWGVWLLDEQGLDALELPGDAMGLVLARVQELGDELREVLLIGAALGIRFRPETVAAVRGGDPQVVMDALTTAAGHRLVEPSHGGLYTFLHDRIREAMLQELEPAASAALHLRIALVLDQLAQVPDPGPELIYALAHHYLQVAPSSREPGVPSADPDRIYDACVAAGRLALAAHAPGKALTFLRHAAGLGRPAHAKFLTLLGSALNQDGQFDDAADCFEQALPLQPDALGRAGVLALLADLYRSTWNLETAREAVRRGLSELGSALPTSAAARVLTVLGRYLLAGVAARTGRFGYTSERQRSRFELLARLHEIGALIGAFSESFDEMVLHDVSGLYWANRIGHGAQYARSQAAFGIVSGLVRMRKVSARAFRAAEAAAQDPGTRASVACSRGVVPYLVGSDEQPWVDALAEFGRYLDVSSFCDSATAMQLVYIVRGDIARAQRLQDESARRVALGKSRTVDLVRPAIPLGHAISGRHAEAGHALEFFVDQLVNGSGPERISHRAFVTLFVLNEQGELGAPFDRAGELLENFSTRPDRVIRALRTMYATLAQGRLAQARAASGSERDRRLGQARRAIKMLTVAADSAELKDRLIILRADYALVEGDPRTALALLGSRDPFLGIDSPLAAFDAALVRATALRAGGADAAEVARYADVAVSIAEERGFIHRAARVRDEFGISGGRNYPGKLFTPTQVSSGGTTSISAGIDRQRLLALEQVALAASRVLDPGELARIALDETIRILSADRAFLFLVDDTGRLVPHLGRGSDGSDIGDLSGYSASLVARVHQTQEPLVVTGTEEGAALGAESVVLHGLRSVMLAPLQLDGRCLGVVYLDSQVAKGIFSAADVGILTALTNYVATTLETARAAQLEISVRTAQRQRDLAEGLRTALESMSDTLDPQQVLDRLIDAAPRVVSCRTALLVTAGDPACGALLEQGSPPSRGGHASAGTAPAALAALRSDRLHPGLAGPVARELDAATAWAALPLRSRGTLLGALLLTSDDDDLALSQQIEVAATLVAQAMTAYDNASLFAQVQKLAVADELTGIANRRRFFELADRELATAIRHQRPLAAVMLDIDHFKKVNDTYGHPTGDDVITVVAGRLKAQIRGGDVLGRYGGEEFALLLPEAQPGSDLLDRFGAVIGVEPVQTRSGPLRITVSVGVTWLKPGDVAVPDLLARADQALYQAKSDGRDCLRTA